MLRNTSWTIIGIGTLALAAACGDNGGGSASNSATGTTSGDSDTETSSATSAATSSTSASSTSNSGSGTEGMTSDPTEGQTTTTGSSTSSATTEGSTTSGVIDTTSTSTSEGTSTGGSSTTGNDTDGGPCPLVDMHLPCDANSNDALHALGLNCTSLGNMYQDNVNAVSVAKLSFMAPPPMMGKQSWQVAKSYGTFVDPNTQQPFWGPREGEKVLLISSGLLPPPNGQGAVIVPGSEVYNDTAIGGQWDSDSMPPPMSPQKGSPDPMGFKNCDGVNDCSNTLFDQWQLGGGDAEDKMWFSFEVSAPAIANGDQVDANGYTFDFAYFSAEFPEFVDTEYNDIFVVWQASEEYTGNVTFINGQPLTVTALWPIDYQGECDFFDPQCQGMDPHLEGTGYINDGGATGWYKATGGVKPGETFTLAFSVFDMGDSTYDTTAILDNWAWDCMGCIPSEVNSCGIEPQ